MIMMTAAKAKVIFQHLKMFSSFLGGGQGQLNSIADVAV